MPRKRKGRPLHGWLIIDKPLEISSSQVVGKARWLSKAQKAGHGGTLDPLASGLLPIAFGEATKTTSYAMDGRKTYQFHVTFGESRTTDDAEGDVVATSDVRPSMAEVEAVLPQFVGDIQQVPPAFSALKVDGKRAYELARAGDAPEMQARTVSIHGLALESVVDEHIIAFVVDCGKGTYVRSLARDIAEALGTVGYVSLLRRTKVGPFTLEHAISLEKLEEVCKKNAVEEVLRPIEDVLDDIPAVSLTQSQADDLRFGRAIEVAVPDTDVALAMYGTTPVALSTVTAGLLKPVRVFNI